MAILILMRHGETTWNTSELLQGSYDVPLSTQGQRSVERIVPIVHSFRPNSVVTSDLWRARETARILGFAEALIDHRWREADFGSWTGRSKASLERAGNGDYQAWREGRYSPPRAESWQELYVRVESAVKDLLEEPGDTLVVTHSGPIRAAMACLLGLQPGKLGSVHPPSVTVLEVQYRPRLLAYNVTVKASIEDTTD